MMGTRDRVRPWVCAGRFYPAEPARLAETVDGLLAGVSPTADHDSPVALVVPHAGYDYSGPVAASGYRRLAARRQLVRRVVILGPAHFLPLAAMALPHHDAFATPLGEIVVDDAARALAQTLPAVTVSATAHYREHSIEVQLPFLQRSLGPDISIVPIVVGAVETHLVADLITTLQTDESTVVVVSTDLSHYHDQSTAQRLDRSTAAAILRRDASTIGERAACGRYALRGLIEAARRLRLDVRQLDLRTSADTAGDPATVVGYGAFGIYLTPDSIRKDIQPE
jgi:AmmeMemoRadiSam system protein B